MGVFDALLNTTDTAAGVPIVDAANPVNWGRLGQALASSVVAAVAVGVTDIFGGIAATWEALLGGLTEFFVGQAETAPAGLVDVTFGRLAAAATAFWEFNLEQFGIFAAPFSVAIVLLVAFISVQGYREAIEQFGGGG